ncbi:P-loop containing nucleoside triphosphate hydrolase protein [Crassisporium funariophilum]|nr:P-loop containing nucleoside triphosphate hydrolase protein [Crassisporium funariophilum]
MYNPSSGSQNNSNMSVPAISATNLTFAHNTFSPNSLTDVNFELAPGSRTILIGANGAGKSTLLQLLAGKKLISKAGADVRVKGRDVFRDSPPGVTFLGTEWAMNPVVRGDILVSAFLDSVGGYRHKERRDRLLDLLDIDLDWHMHNISDGERRRVQLCFGLMTPWDVLLLDEVTVDLDVLVRDDLLKFLKADSEERGATILYATHIFDGLNDFPTHIAHMHLGSFVEQTPWPITDNLPIAARFPASTPLYSVALQWLKDDRDIRYSLEHRGRKMRGARRNETVPSDSETFYKKYDYSH